MGYENYRKKLDKGTLEIPKDFLNKMGIHGDEEINVRFDRYDKLMIEKIEDHKDKRLSQNAFKEYMDKFNQIRELIGMDMTMYVHETGKGDFQIFMAEDFGYSERKIKIVYPVWEPKTVEVWIKSRDDEIIEITENLLTENFGEDWDEDDDETWDEYEKIAIEEYYEHIQKKIENRIEEIWGVKHYRVFAERNNVIFK